MSPQSVRLPVGESPHQALLTRHLHLKMEVGPNGPAVLAQRSPQPCPSRALRGTFASEACSPDSDAPETDKGQAQ